MKANDIDGDGRSEIIVSSPWGLGVLGLGGNTLASQMLRPNGSRIGDWLLQTDENQFGAIANFCNQGRMEVVVKSGWGVGLLDLHSSNGASPLMAANGTRFGGWLLNTDNDDFGPAGDFDGDGVSELIVSSGWGMGLLKTSGASFDAPFMAPNGTKLGDWMLNAPDNRFGPIGDFDGDGHDEILVQSLWGIGVLKLVDGRLKSVAMLPNGAALGAWKLDVHACRFLVSGNFTTGQPAQILAVDAGGVAILKLAGNSFSLVARASNGNYCGGWMVNSAGDRFGPAADFDGDGVSEILVSSNWGMGVLKVSGANLTSVAIAPNGTRLGEWVLNTSSDRLNRVGHYSGRANAEILASSGWGAGILKVSEDSFTSVAMAPNQGKLGDWRLNTFDNDLEHGDQQCHAVIIHHGEWASSVNNTVAAMRRRGCTVHASDAADAGLKCLQLLAMNLKVGDRLFVYLAGHGWADRQPGDFTQATSDRHGIQFNTGSLRLRELAPLFASLGNRGVDLTVFDGSCEGGETVHRASGERYCAMATTGLWSPAYVDTPDPSGAIASDSKPGRFGLWWNDHHITASRINGQIMTQILAQGPHRLHQRLHRNDASPLARCALLARSTICNLMIPGWNYFLEGLGCYLYQYVNLDLSAEQKAKLTTSAEDYIGQVEAIIHPQLVLIQDYKRLISDFGINHLAGQIYAGRFDTAWRMLAEDPDWDVRGNPQKHSQRMLGVVPDPFRPEEGFIGLANQALNSILLLEHLYVQQLSLLRQMDDELRSGWHFQGAPAPNFTLKAAPARHTVEANIERNRVDMEEARRFKHLLNQHAFKPEALVGLLEQAPIGHDADRLQLKPALLTRIEKGPLIREIHFADMNKVRQLGARVSANFTDQYWLIARLNMLLGLVEDAIVAVHARSAANPAEVDQF